MSKMFLIVQKTYRPTQGRGEGLRIVENRTATVVTEEIADLLRQSPPEVEAVDATWTDVVELTTVSTVEEWEAQKLQASRLKALESLVKAGIGLAAINAMMTPKLSEGETAHLIELAQKPKAKRGRPAKATATAETSPENDTAATDDDDVFNGF